MEYGAVGSRFEAEPEGSFNRPSWYMDSCARGDGRSDIERAASEGRIAVRFIRHSTVSNFHASMRRARVTVVYKILASCGNMDGRHLLSVQRYKILPTLFEDHRSHRSLAISRHIRAGRGSCSICYPQMCAPHGARGAGDPGLACPPQTCSQ